MIRYKFGDATEHKNGVLVHCVNDLGVMGAGIAKAIADKWPKIYNEYIAWYKNNNCGINNYPFQLGYTQYIKVEDNLYVCNLIGQRGIKKFYDLPPVRYQSVLEGLYRVRNFMQENNLKELVSGRICCGLAGGSWEVIEKILHRVFNQTDILVTIYDVLEWEGTIYE